MGDLDGEAGRVGVREPEVEELVRSSMARGGGGTARAGELNGDGRGEGVESSSIPVRRAALSCTDPRSEIPFQHPTMNLIVRSPRVSDPSEAL